MKTDHHLQLTVDFPSSFSVREFVVREQLHELYRVELVVVSTDPAVDLDALIGKDARFELQRDASMAKRSWTGLVTDCEHIGADDDELTTYRIVIHPTLWLLTQRRNYRIFQQSSDPNSAKAVLADWEIAPRCSYDDALYPGRKYRVQYAESDYHFVRRLLEDAGITFHFEDQEGDNRLVLSDAPHSNARRDSPLHYEQRAVGGTVREHATQVVVTRRLRPGRYTQRDVDYRRSPEYPLLASTEAGEAIEQRLERFHQNYGAFLFSAPSDGASPVADDRGAARTDLAVGQRQVERRLAAKRSDAHRCRFLTTAHDLAPGVVFEFGDHPRQELAEGRRLLVVGGELSGKATGDWEHRVDAAFADQPFHPPLSTPKPSTFGVESATVVGPDDDEIHTDEFARVRVQFHWDREGKRDPQASCWIPVSQPWGGAGFGALNIPRVGQEVLIDFLGADPDRPVVVGRVFTKTNPVPYKLPEHKTVSGLRSRSANRMVMGAADGTVAAAPSFASLGGFGAVPTPDGLAMGPSLLHASLQEQLFGAISPDSGTHRWPGSEITMDDRFGQEVLYMQAERDMNVVVKNSQTTVVGNRRAAKIGSDDITDVDHQQFIQVAQDRCIKVEGSQNHVVTRDVRQESTGGSQHFISKEAHTSTAKNQSHAASELVVFTVGDSTLLMRPDFVIIQTPYLFMNPGGDAVKAALLDGTRPMSPNESAAAAEAKARADFKGYLDSELDAGRIRSGASGSEVKDQLHLRSFSPPEAPGGQSALVDEWMMERQRANFPTWLEQNGYSASDMPFEAVRDLVPLKY